MVWRTTLQFVRYTGAVFANQNCTKMEELRAGNVFKNYSQVSASAESTSVCPFYVLVNIDSGDTRGKLCPEVLHLEQKLMLRCHFDVR